jgi:hypothetical protein
LRRQQKGKFWAGAKFAFLHQKKEQKLKDVRGQILM